jgi:hypothetical protein
LGATTNLGSVSIVGNPVLATLAGWSIPAALRGLSLSSNAMTTLSLPVVTIGSGGLGIDEPGLQSLTFNALTSVDGALTISGTSPLAVAWPALARIGGDLIFGPVQLASIAAPLLANVGGRLVMENTTATNFNLPALAAVGADISISQTVGSISLNALASVRQLSLTSNPQLTSLGLDALREVANDITFVTNPLLPQLRFVSLQAVGGDVRLEGAAALTQVDFSALRSVRNFTMLSVGVTGLTANQLTSAAAISLRATSLASLSLASLTTATSLDVSDSRITSLAGLNPLLSLFGSLTVTSNPLLTDLGLAGLASVASATVSGNVALSQCQVRALFTRLSLSCFEPTNSFTNCYPNSTPVVTCP